MKSLIISIVALSCVVSYGALSGIDAAWETQIEWSPKLAYDSATTSYNSGSPWNKDLMGTGGSKDKLDELRINGATLSGSDGVAADVNSLRLGRATTHTGTKNFWMQPVDLKNVNGASGVWGTDINADPYIYAVSDQQIKLSVKVSDINLTADKTMNARFVFNLWDRKKPNGSPNANGNYIGLMIHDPNNGEQEHLRLSTYGTANMFETGTLSDGSSSNPEESNKRVTAYYITPNDGTEVMGVSGSYEFDLRFDRVTGEYAVDVNGTQVLSGQMATGGNGIAGIDCYGWEFKNMSPGDSIDIESFSISSISEIVPVQTPIEVYYQETSSGTNVFNTVNGYTPNTNGNILAQSGFADYGSEINWTTIIQTGNSVAWSASTPSVAGTNATKLTSIWKWKAVGSNDNIENNGIILSNREDLWVAPGVGAYAEVDNPYTQFNIDSDISVAALLGSGRKDQGSNLGSFVSVKDGGSLTVEGTVAPEYNLAWVDGKTQLGNWGDSNNADYAMTLEVDGGSFTAVEDIITVAHSRAAGNLDITARGGSIVADTIRVGYDAAYRSMGTVDIDGGSLTTTNLYVGNASPGVVNVSGGQLIVPTNGSIRIGFNRDNVPASQHGTPGVGTVPFNGSGLVDINGGTLNATASNTLVIVGRDDLLSGGTNEVESIYGGSSKTAELRIRNGGTANFTAYNKLQIGRNSDGILTIDNGGMLNGSDEPLSIGTGPANGTLNIYGGAINLTGGRIDIGGWYGGSATVNMSGGTITADSIVMQNTGPAYTNNGVSTVNQTRGTVTTTGGEARFGVNGDAIYNIGGGHHTAMLVINPILESYTATSNNIGKLNLSYGGHDSTLNILKEGIVHVNSISLDSVNTDNDSDTDAAVLNLNDRGTLIVEGTYASALGVADGAEINISEGQFLWRMRPLAAVSNMQAIASYINLTGGDGVNAVPQGGIEVFSKDGYTLYAVGYHTTNRTYSIEADDNSWYTRFVSVEASLVQSPYSAWTADYGVTGLETEDYDSDGMNNFTEYALNGDPTNASVKGQTLQLKDKGSNLFKFIHAKLANDSSVTYRLLDTTNLLIGSFSTNDYVSQDESLAVGDYIMVTNNYDMSVKPVQFIELEIEGDN